jgi:hypothetical protein
VEVNRTAMLQEHFDEAAGVQAQAQSHATRLQ